MIVVEKKVLINSSPKEIYEIITNNEFYLWRSDLSEVKIIDNKNFIEYTNKKFPTFFSIIKKTKNKKYEACMNNNNLEGKFIVELKQVENKTELIIREEVEIIDNKKKMLGKLFLKKMQKKYIDDLIKELESNR